LFLSRNADRTSTNQHLKLSSDIFEIAKCVKIEISLEEITVTGNDVIVWYV
jgi:hypothetical protein